MAAVYSDTDEVIWSEKKLNIHNLATFSIVYFLGKQF